MTFKYRKKPVEIEAVQFDDDDSDETRFYPDWFLEAMRNGVISFIDGSWYVQTLESGRLVPKHLITNKDYIIRGIQGELYPCKPDIFAATYDKVE